MGKYKDDAAAAAKDTDTELSGQFKSLTADDISILFPTETDRTKLNELIQIVQSATTENEQIVKLKENFDNCAIAALRLIKSTLL